MESGKEADCQETETKSETSLATQRIKIPNVCLFSVLSCCSHIQYLTLGDHLLKGRKSCPGLLHLTATSAEVKRWEDFHSLNISTTYLLIKPLLCTTTEVCCKTGNCTLHYHFMQGPKCSLSQQFLKTKYSIFSRVEDTKFSLLHHTGSSVFSWTLAPFFHHKNAMQKEQKQKARKTW